MGGFLKSILRYPGGKSKSVDLIAPLAPPFKEYREPFIGGGGLFLHFIQSKSEVFFRINDLYEPVANFWASLKRLDIMEDSLLTLRSWRETYATRGRELHTKCIGMLDDKSLPEHTRALAFYALNRMTFSGLSLCGGYSEEAFRKRFTESSIDRFYLGNMLLSANRNASRLTVTCGDYLPVIHEEGDDVFIYLDPPYYTATKSNLYGNNGDIHRKFDHVQFAEDMRVCEHKWLITYDDCEYIRKLFSWACVVPWSLNYAMKESGRGKGNELFIANYDINQKALQPLAM